MGTLIGPGTQAHTEWTLVRAGHRLTCALITTPRGEYVLRLSHDGQRIMDEPCQSPQHALKRSLEALGVLVSRGWFHDGANN